MKSLAVLISAVLVFSGCASKPKYSQITYDEFSIDLAYDNPNITDAERAEAIEKFYAQRIRSNPIDTSRVRFRPVIDPNIPCKGNSCNYDLDLVQCNGIANSNTNYGNNTLASAAAGAALGAAIGAVAGVDVGYVAAGGATGGAIGGLANAAANNYQIVARCMQGRGYSVLR